MKEQLNYIMRGGATKRFHTETTIQTQSVAEHSWGVAMLLEVLYGWVSPKTPSVRLPYAALVHDITEFQTGDTPAPVKRVSKEVKDALDTLEQAYMDESHLRHALLKDDEARKLKMADCMDGMLFCVRERRLGNTDIARVYANFGAYVLQLEPVGREQEMYNLIMEMWYDAVGKR